MATIRTNSTRSEGLSLPLKIGYGTPGFANFITFNILITYGMYYFVDVVGLPSAFAGIVFSVATIWDAITDPLIGMISDNRDPKKGRRRPFLLGVAVPFGVVFWLLFTDFGLGKTGTLIYFFVMSLAYRTVLTLLDVPYTALGAEMTQSYDERSSLFGIRNIFSQGACLVSTFTLVAVARIGDATGSVKVGWSAVAGFFAVLSIITILIGWRATRGHELTEVGEEEKTTYKHYLEVFRNRPFRFMIGLWALSIVSQAFINTVCIFYFLSTLQMTEGQVATSLLIVFISATLWAPGLAYLSRKTSKTFAWIFAMASWGLLLLVFPLFVLEPGSITMLYVWMALMGAGVGGQYQVAWSMIPDCVEVDEYITGKRREGIYYAIVTFTQKAATAAAYFAAGILLAWVGYEAGVDPTPETLEGLKNTFAYGSALPLFLSCLVAFLNPMTRQRHKSLCEALRLRRDGKQHSVADFRELLAGHTLVAE